MENIIQKENESNDVEVVDKLTPLRKVSLWRVPRLVWWSGLALRRRSSARIVRNHQTEFEYSKRAGTSGVSGQLYETKLLCLLLLRALNDKDIKEFHLGTNIDGIGDMDDICLRYRVRCQRRPIMLFVQAKHIYDCEKRRISIEDLRSACGGFSLRKYFESYLTIKSRFWNDNKDPMFKGDFGNVKCYFIIYTPAKDCINKKKVSQPVSEKVHYLMNTAENNEVFQYDYNEDDIENLTKVTVLERFKKLGAVFLEFIMSAKDKSEKILLDQLIARYHVVMGRKVLQQCEKQQVNGDYRMWVFRPPFFESDCQYLIALKKVFVNELSTKCWDHSKITDEDIEKYKIALLHPGAASFSELIGKIVIYNSKIKKLQLVEIKALRKEIKTSEFQALLDQFNEINTKENIICKAVEIKLLSMKIKLPLAFGNLDMTFRGNRAKIEKRMKAVAEKLMHLFEVNNHTKIVDINDAIVGPGKMIEQGIININGGIGSAVGNLLILDRNTKMLKFDLNNKELPVNAGLFLKELRNSKYMPVNEELSNYRFKININGFPKDSFHGDEFDRRQAKDFFNKLWFYTNQAKENEIERILKNDIKENHERSGNRFKLKIDPHDIFLRTHDEVQKWWMRADKAQYLTRSDDLFLQAKFAVHSQRLVNRRCSSCYN